MTYEDTYLPLKWWNSNLRCCRKPNLLDKKIKWNILLSVFLYIQLVFIYAAYNDKTRREMDANAYILVSITQLFVLFLLE